LLSEMSRGAQLAFVNAGQLYAEGDVLRRSGSTSRSLFLHQISLEECGKIEIIGGWAANLLLGGEVNIRRMTQAFRSHEAKNYANAYFAKLTQDELEARKQKDTKRAVEAFERLQEKFHEESNSAKNASLYVDFKDDRFLAPSDFITEEMAVGIAAVNAYFLELTGPKVRMLERMAKDSGILERTGKWFAERAEELRRQAPDDQTAAMETLIQGVFDRYKIEEQLE
jgi:AbiV family abortive infection protein